MDLTHQQTLFFQFSDFLRRCLLPGAGTANPNPPLETDRLAAATSVEAQVARRRQLRAARQRLRLAAL